MAHRWGASYLGAVPRLEFEPLHLLTDQMLGGRERVKGARGLGPSTCKAGAGGLREVAFAPLHCQPM